MLELLILGFALGLRHSSDADHLAAVSNLLGDDLEAVGNRGASAAAGLGALWGAGHLAAVCAAGGALLAFRLRMPAWWESSLAALVGAVLLALGCRTIHRCLAGRFHFHLHRHGRRWHAHWHAHPRGAAHEPPSSHRAHLPGSGISFGWPPLLVPFQLFRPELLLENPLLPPPQSGAAATTPSIERNTQVVAAASCPESAAADRKVRRARDKREQPGKQSHARIVGTALVGVLHGLAGSAGLTLLVVAALPSRLAGVLFLLAFGLGALVGMVAFSALVGGLLARPLPASRQPSWMYGVRLLGGAATAAFGAFLACRALFPAAGPTSW